MPRLLCGGEEGFFHDTIRRGGALRQLGRERQEILLHGVFQSGSASGGVYRGEFHPVAPILEPSSVKIQHEIRYDSAPAAIGLDFLTLRFLMTAWFMVSRFLSLLHTGSQESIVICAAAVNLPARVGQILAYENHRVAAQVEQQVKGAGGHGSPALYVSNGFGISLYPVHDRGGFPPRVSMPVREILGCGAEDPGAAV
jgi:hypothetical protein